MSDNEHFGISSERLADLGLDAEDYARIERNAMFAAILGLLCHVCAMMACCGSIFISVPGLALGIVALVLSKGVLDSGVGGGPGAYARTSIAMSVIGIGWNGLVSLVCCAYIGLSGFVGFMSILGEL
jgi:hypothetical protein